MCLGNETTICTWSNKGSIYAPLYCCHAYCRWQKGVGNIQYSWFLWIWFPALASLLHWYDQPQLKPEPAVEKKYKSIWTMITFCHLVCKFNHNGVKVNKSRCNKKCRCSNLRHLENYLLQMKRNPMYVAIKFKMICSHQNSPS